MELAKHEREVVGHWVRMCDSDDGVDVGMWIKDVSDWKLPVEEEMVVVGENRRVGGGGCVGPGSENGMSLSS